MAPDQDQMHVVDHRTGEPVPGERRNILQEAARIARGRIRDLARVEARELDGLILPGGYGVAKNLSDFAVKGAQGSPHPDLLRLCLDLWKARKPIGAICIAPAVLALVLKRAESGASLTIGDDPDTAAALEALGSRHVVCPVEDFVADEENRICSAPAYMIDARISEVDMGIAKVVARVLEWAS